MLGIGGWHLGNMKDQQEAIRVMHAAIDEGLTFFDNSWDYHDGHSEELMGRALAMDRRRSEVFLMSKVCDRDYDGAMRHLEDSLRRLQTDHLDLWQFHEVNWDQDPDWIFEKGGLRAALEARVQGKVRYIGFTGHKNALVHVKMLQKPFEWDTVQMPNNVLDQHYGSYRYQVMPTCVERGIGVIGMKGLGGGAPDGTILANLDLSVEELLRYCWSQPIAVQVTGINSMEHLKRNLTAARSFTPLSKDEAAELAHRVEDSASHGRFEPFKSTMGYEGPHHLKQRGMTA